MQVPNLHPSVFISSTVKEFFDLRSAIAYTLREQGFTVLLSEDKEFPIRGDRPAPEECFTNVRESDYYILIVGSTRGSLHDGISITRQEYRVARDAFLAKRQPILFLFLREGAQRAAAIDEADHLKSFIHEIEHPENKNSPSFLTRFRDFENVMNSLANSPMNLGRNLSETLIRHSLLSELTSNLALMSERQGTTAFPTHRHMARARDQIQFPENLDALITISEDEARSLGYSITVKAMAENLKTRAIEDAFNNGLFLKFNPADGALQELPAHQALRETLDGIQALKNRGTSTGPIKWDENIAIAISQRNQTRPNSLELSSADLALAFVYHNRLENLFRTHLALCQLLLGLTKEKELPPFDRLPISPLGNEMEKQIHAERVSGAEISRLIKNNISPFGSRAPREYFGKTREEQIKEVTDSMSATFTGLGIDPNQHKDALEEAAKHYWDDDTASPDEGIKDLRPG